MSSLHVFHIASSTRWRKSIFNFFLIFELLVGRLIHVNANCGNMQVLETGGISCNLIKEIVNAHNELRQAVAQGSIKNQPIAVSMREFYWDEELANGAQDWANQCTFAHNEDKDREVARFHVGQNLALSKSKREHPSPEKEFRRQINNWFKEHEVFKFGPILKIEDLESVGHYTQVVWAKTYLVGCGYSRYKSSSNVTYKLYVCHYGPTGNEIDREPYEPGRQNCPKNLIKSKKYSKLCSLKESPANPCAVESKRKNTHTRKYTKLDTEGQKFRGGRKFLSPPKKKIETVDNRDKTKKKQLFNETLAKNNIILKIIFNFFLPFGLVDNRKNSESKEIILIDENFSYN